MNTADKIIATVGVVTVMMTAGLAFWPATTSQAGNAPASQQSEDSAAPQESPSSDTITGWNLFRQMQRMQEEIDRAIRDATEQFKVRSGPTPFAPDTGYSSSFDLRDSKDHYELRAYLPDVNASDVKVRIDDDRTLHVSVNQRKQEKKDTPNGSESFTELGEYEQVVTLPESVKSNDMKIDRRGHEIVITIPKADSAKADSV
jgi:HSP20 family protein